jgi:hypothetical protein
MFLTGVRGSAFFGQLLLQVGLLEPVVQKFARLAVEYRAHFRDGAEPDAANFSRAQQRQLRFGHADPRAQLLTSHLSLGKHDVECDDDWHLDKSVVFGFQSRGGGHQPTDHDQRQSERRQHYIRR